MTGRRLTTAATIVGASLICAFTAVLVVFFLPLHVGAAPLPVSVLVAAGVLVVVPRGCLALTGQFLAAVVPVAIWAVVTFGLVLYRSPLYPQVPLAVWDWRLMLLFGVGGLAATVTLATVRPLGPAVGRPGEVSGADHAGGY